MRILLTGGFGYVGSFLIHHLAESKGVDRPPLRIRVLDNLSRGRFGGLLNLPEAPAVEFIEGDILDPASVRRALEDVDAVVHLAAVVRTPFSFEHPESTEAVNHWGTSRLVELCVEAGIQRFIHASSASVYGAGDLVDEDSPLQPVGPYSTSKLEAERVVQAVGEREMETTILRFGTVYGLSPCMRFDAVPNRFAYLAAIGRPVTVFGGGEQYRPLVHIRDAAEAVRMALSEADQCRGKVFNVVSENVSVRQMAVAVQKVFPGARPVHTARDAMTRISLQASGERLRHVGWSPSASLEDGMREIGATLGPFEPALGAVFGLEVQG